MKQTTMKCNEVSKDKKKWYIIDAKGQVLGRLSTTIANLLRGTNKPDQVQYEDCGDNVIVINCKDVVLTGNKLEDKIYYRHSGYIGGLTKISAEKMLEKFPERLIYSAVKNMLQKNRLARKQIKKLYLYKGSEHKNQGQKPIVFENTYK